VACRFLISLLLKKETIPTKGTAASSMLFTRPLASITGLTLLALGILVLLPDCASACSCASLGSQQEQVKQALSDSEAVFSGEVVDVEKERAATASHPGTVTVTLQVSEVLKGPQRETLEVSTPSTGSACRYPFEEGREYLVYAYGKQDLKVDLCSETKLLSKAGADLAVLGNGEKPKDGGDALTDTSGGVPARAVVGLAGLAMAASFLVMVRLVRNG
jgi:hypothetical protein